MSFSAQTQRDLVELVRLVVENKGRAEHEAWLRSSRWGSIPDDIEYDKSEGATLTIAGQEYIQYDKCLESLQAETALEYMSRREIDRELWHFVCEVFLQSHLLKDGGSVKRKVDLLQKRLVKPIEQYEVLIPIENGLNLGEHCFEIAGVKILEMSANDALNWGIKKDKPLHSRLHEAVVNNRAVALIDERGCDPWKAADRARQRLSTALNTLRVSLLVDHDPRIIGWKIHDEQMLFRQGQDIGVKKHGSSDLVLPGWRRGFQSIELRIDDTLSKQIALSTGLVDSLFEKNGVRGRIRDRLVRAMEWIGDSVTREALDIKVVDICTALETLLATKEDKRKGEAIALRMMLLYSLLDRPFFNPVQVLELYNKRSEIVHGSDKDICSDSEYSTSRWITIDIFKHTLIYIERNNITKHADFIRSLQTDKALVEKAVDFWKPYPKYQKDITEAAKQMTAKPRP